MTSIETLAAVNAGVKTVQLKVKELSDRNNVKVIKRRKDSAFARLLVKKIFARVIIKITEIVHLHMLEKNVYKLVVP